MNQIASRTPTVEIRTDAQVHPAPQPTAVDQINRSLDRGVAWIGGRISDGIDWLGGRFDRATDWVIDNRSTIHEYGECLDALLEAKPGKIFDQCLEAGEKHGQTLWGGGVRVAD